jgi:hypothetical protein
VTRVGCTGHQSLTPTTRRDVAAAIARVLAEQSEGTLVGFSSLAAGADQLFALAVLAAGGNCMPSFLARGMNEALLLTRRATPTRPYLLSLTTP